jgi:hypothetical protein
MALMAGSIAPGSALSCLDELAGEAVECEFHGCHDVYRQRPEPDDLRHRGRTRDCDAEFLRLHGMVGRGAAAGLRDFWMGLFRSGIDL